IDRVNAHDENIYEKMQIATRSLRKQQAELKATRQAQTDALDELRARGAAIDAKLAQAEAQEQAAATAAAATAPTTVPAAATETTNTTAGAVPASAATSTSATTTTTTVPPPTTPAPPPNYVGTPGTSPHHDDPFLTCVRQR